MEQGRMTVLLMLFVWCLGAAGAVVDNSTLLPVIEDDNRVKLEPASNGSAASPDWVKGLILVEASVASASKDGTVRGMEPVLDHLAEIGVNGIWITPIQEGRHYGNYGIHTVSRSLTGADEMPERWKRIKAFVDAAHRRNIRVFFDVVSWGVNRNAPLYREKPEWFSGPSKPGYNGWNWNWENPELCEWFSSRLVEWILLTGADGFRCDCAPRYAGYEPYRTARERLLRMGRKIALIGEHASSRQGVFDFDQCGFLPEPGRTRPMGDVFLSKNMVDLIRSGDELGALDSEEPPGRKRFYSFLFSSHDSKSYFVQGNPVRFGYPLFLPFLPIWYLGEEWNNAYTRDVPPYWLWANAVNWKLKGQNQEFFELVKRMIRIRRLHPDIFEYFPDDHRQAAICKVETDHPELLQAYARYRNGKAILIVPNNSGSTTTFRITVPYREAAVRAGQVTITDLLGKRELVSGKPENFKVEIPAEGLGIYLVSSEQ